jgi:hypothetical protein
MKRPPLSKDTIDSVLRHREVGRAKDLSAPPRTSGVKNVFEYMSVNRPCLTDQMVEGVLLHPVVQ